MLVVKQSDSDESYEFTLSEIVSGDSSATFKLTSATYQDAALEFILPYVEKYPAGFTAEVYLFKNIHFSQKDIIEVKSKTSGSRIAYFFRLDALFENEILELNEHIYPYIMIGLEYIFGNAQNLQTKFPNLEQLELTVSDFFEEDAIILVLCNELTSKIPDFDFKSYLPNLNLYGFIPFNKDLPIDNFNLNDYIKDNFESLKQNLRDDGVFTFKIDKICESLSGELFITQLYESVIQQKTDSITRFITSYQIIEILIGKILHLKIQSSICANLATLTSLQLKEFLRDIQTEKYRINALLHEFGIPSAEIKQLLKNNLVDLFKHLEDLEYADDEKISTMNITDIFYDFRNKLVHSYRIMHNPNIDKLVTEDKMKQASELSEIFVTEILLNFGKYRLPAGNSRHD